jgi:sec-independent protein translocase protein TatB
MPGFQELLVILVVAALVLGPNRLPKAAADVARLLARIRQEAGGALQDLKHQAKVEGLDEDLRALRGELRDTSSAARRAVDAELRALTDASHTPPPSAQRPEAQEAEPTEREGAATDRAQDQGAPPP